MKKTISKIVITFIFIYLAVCGLLYFIQEKLIFFPEKLAKEYKFNFSQNFDEFYFKTNDKMFLNGILFKAPISKGLIFYLHGNAGSLRSWGEIAKTYTDLNYDLFMLDYRGYGKSEGTIRSEEQLFTDIQSIYDNFKKKYGENKIIILGYSIGTGPATKLASTNHSKLLILQAPYYNLADLMKHKYPMIPAFVLKYKFETNKYLKNCKMPVVIFHGDDDGVIHYQSSVKLKEIFKPADTLITLPGQGHNRISDNPNYIFALEKILR